MFRCVSPEQIADLLEGRLEDLEEEVCGAHLDACPRCREQFLKHTALPDADAWRRAAVEPPPPDDDARALLERLKQDDTPGPLGRTGRAVDQAELLKGESTTKQINVGPAAPRPAPRQGRWPEVPGFEILGELGRGGMGVVYKARQVSHDRTVALKMILAGVHASSEDLGRFHDEAEAVSRLRHPHIVQIFEVGQAEGRFYFVLEFVEGGTLYEKVKGRPLPARSSAQLLESLARAMHYAHERGIVHRDLKPANVLLHGRKAFLDIPEDVDRLPEDWDFRRYMPKITDFGLAKLLDRGSSGHTASGDVVGTPSYMAPEQAQGKQSAIGPATDVYSLGAILYEMLTGRPPFQGATPMDTLFQVHTQEPIPPRKLVREVPAALEVICLKCLRKDPARRYRSAEALADDLRHFLEGQPLQTRGARRVPLARLRRRLIDLWPAVVVFVLTVAAGTMLTTWWLTKRGRPPAGAARRDDQPARESARLRLRLALADCERGEAARGLFDMATLLQEVEGNPALADLADAVRLNLAAWAHTLPELQWLAPDLAAAAALAPGDDLSRIGPERRPRVEPDTAGTMTAWAGHADGAHVLIGHRDGRLELKPLQAGAPATELRKQPAPVSGLAWLDGVTAAVAGADGRVRFVNLPRATAAELAPIRAHAAGTTLVAAGGRGLLLTAGADRAAKLWQARTGELLAALPHPAALHRVAFSGDSAAFLTLDANGTLRRWRVPADDSHNVPLTEARPAAAADVRQPASADPLVAASADGRAVVTLGSDGGPRLTRPGSGRSEPLIAPLPAELRGAAFAPGGRLLLVAWSGGVRLVDVHSALPVGPELSLADLAGARFSDDGKSVLAWSATEARRWPIPEPGADTAEQWRTRLCRHTAIDRTADGTLRHLTAAEWQALPAPEGRTIP